MRRLLVALMLALGAPLAQAILASTDALAAAVPEAPLTVHYRSETIHGVKLFYREAGPADGPVVLLLHGFATSSCCFVGLVGVATMLVAAWLAPYANLIVLLLSGTTIYRLLQDPLQPQPAAPAPDALPRDLTLLNRER